MIKIKDLPQGVREIALKRVKEQGNDPIYFLEKYLTDAFVWSNTPEGDDAWRRAHYKKDYNMVRAANNSVAQESKTRFLTMEPLPERGSRKTVFEKSVNPYDVRDAILQPEKYKNVMFLYSDKTYGDVFLAWNDDPNDRVIFCGERGDEFNQ